MMQKIVVGLLVLTVVGAAGIGIYDASQSSESADATALLASQTDLTQPVEAAVTVTQTPVEQAVDQTIEQTTAQTTTQTAEQAPVTQMSASNGTAQPVQQQQATGQIGEPWQGSGTITKFDTNGMFLASTLSDEIYVELGPQYFWQQQDIVLSVGERVQVEGFFNGDQYHAARVIKADGTQLALRSDEGLPLWSGGAQNGNTQNGNTPGNEGQAQGEPAQVAPEEWVTVEGVITESRGNSLTMQTTDGDLITLQLGQRSFVDSQSITFSIGDEISVIGYWQDDQFNAGEITKTETGERLMLLDPNGRPLWGGPGRGGEQGQGGGSGNSGTQGQSQGQGQGQGQDQGQSSSEKGQGNGGGGNGNGYQGGRNS